MSDDAVISAMRKLGHDDSAILAVIQQMAIDRKEATRASATERQRRLRERNAVTRDSVTVTDVTRDSVTVNPPNKDKRERGCANHEIPLTGNINKKPKPTVLSKSSAGLEILSECLSPETATQVLEYRKAAKAATTEGALRGLAKQFLATGNPEGAALEYMAAGYRGYFPKNQQPRDGPPKRFEKRNPWFEMMENELSKANGNGGENNADFGEPAEDFTGETLDLIPSEFHLEN